MENEHSSVRISYAAMRIVRRYAAFAGCSQQQAVADCIAYTLDPSGLGERLSIVDAIRDKVIESSSTMLG